MNAQTDHLKERIISVDALRGLAMFLILAIDIGGAPIFRTFTELWGKDFAKASSGQFSYAFSEGLRLCHIAMPMFLFVVGVVIPFSIKERISGKNIKAIYLHIIKRSVILFILGLIAGGHLLSLHFREIRVYNNVLEYIAVGYLICSVIVLNSTRKFQVIFTSSLLIIYWLLFLIIPVPGGDGNPFSSKMNLAVFIDNVVLGNHHNPGSWQVIATMSFIANIMTGVLMGHILFGARSGPAKVKQLAVAGISMTAAGLIWGMFFPVIRSLWTSSFVLVTCGTSTLILALFYYLLDIRCHKKRAFFFIVFGVNSIAIYMMAHLFDFRLIGNIIVGGFSELFSGQVRNFIQALAAMAVMWLIMYYMYLKKTFIKV